jgi:hypothetical protein
MKATMQSTSKTIILNGLNLRVWEGVSETGVKFVALVNRLAAANPQDQISVVRELTAKHKDSDPALSPALTTLDPLAFPEVPAAEKGPKSA